MARMALKGNKIVPVLSETTVPAGLNCIYKRWRNNRRRRTIVMLFVFNCRESLMLQCSWNDEEMLMNKTEGFYCPPEKLLV